MHTRMLATALCALSPVSWIAAQSNAPTFTAQSKRLVSARGDIQSLPSSAPTDVTFRGHCENTLTFQLPASELDPGTGLYTPPQFVGYWKVTDAAGIPVCTEYAPAGARAWYSIAPSGALVRVTSFDPQVGAGTCTLKVPVGGATEEITLPGLATPLSSICVALGLTGDVALDGQGVPSGAYALVTTDVTTFLPTHSLVLETQQMALGDVVHGVVLLDSSPTSATSISIQPTVFGDGIVVPADLAFGVGQQIATFQYYPLRNSSHVLELKDPVSQAVLAQSFPVVVGAAESFPGRYPESGAPVPPTFQAMWNDPVASIGPGSSDMDWKEFFGSRMYMQCIPAACLVTRTGHKTVCGKCEFVLDDDEYPECTTTDFPYVVPASCGPIWTSTVQSCCFNSAPPATLTCDLYHYEGTTIVECVSVEVPFFSTSIGLKKGCCKYIKVPGQAAKTVPNCYTFLSASCYGS